MTEPASDPRRVFVLGAGMIGGAMAQDLAASGFEVHIADASADALDRVRAKAPVETHPADLSNSEVVRSLVKGSRLVIGALPSVMGLQSVRAAIEAGCDMVDISFMTEDPRALDSMARERGVTVMTDCGVAPGLTNMMAAYAARQFDACLSIEMSVGGLPAVREWPFNYKAGFAPWDVIEIYTRPATVVENGRVVVKEAMEGLELIDVPGVGTLESFITDGLRSLVDTVKVPNMVERTLRWPGHVELMKIFRKTGFFSLDPITVSGRSLRPRDVTAALLFPMWNFKDDEGDITVMRVRALGTRGGAPARFTFDFVDRYDPRTGLRSMSRSTGFTATGVAGLILDGAFRAPGVHMPEALGAEPDLLARVLDHLRARGIRCEMFSGV